MDPRASGLPGMCGARAGHPAARAAAHRLLWRGQCPRIAKPWLPGVCLLALFHSSYLSEIFRGAWESIGASQLEAARAVGFNQQQTWRFVIFPQAFRRALPGTAGQMVSLIKDSSLLSVIGVEELTQMVRAANAQAYTALEGFIPLAVLYILLTIPLSWWTRRIEERYKFET
ncbi:amino acid ABC transporter permease [Verrucomicrobium spinosum]|uniref:amino acid ABC transporter permease n=1 Tax=Verrucomicrobium spinosum TaxID=2736 RepID=UPI0009E66818|nr:amino acid ABC transporter permease [Verrucomicrobium spinosum]